jgi:hypothetical protein
MWMLDVFCCALGCVTFLWLLNTQQAGDQSAKARSALERLDLTRKDLASSLAQLGGLNSEVERLAGRLRIALDDQAHLTGELGTAYAEARALSGRLDEANRTLGATRADAEATRAALVAAEAKSDLRAADLAAARDLATLKAKELVAVEARAKNAEADLLLKKASIDSLMKKSDAANAALDQLAKLIGDRSAERTELEAKFLSLQRDISELENKLAGLEKTKDAMSATAKAANEKAKADLESAKTDAAKVAQDLAVARKTIAELEAKAAGSGTDRAMIIDLQGQNAKLADKLNKIQVEAETRFAGVAMTGKRVVFLVDISGSMAKTDDRTPNPAKWPLVVDTVAKVMRSIPTLEKYQVIIFSRSARWLMAPAGQWRNYEGEKSVTDVKTELLKVVVDGDTNLHSGFDLTFGLRSQGLDTIYLFSDGLPTSGPGLTVAQENLDEDKRSALLGDYLHFQLRTTWNPAREGSRVRINSIGFFYQSPNVGAFLWNLSRENDGSFVGMSKP